MPALHEPQSQSIFFFFFLGGGGGGGGGGSISVEKKYLRGTARVHPTSPQLQATWPRKWR